MSDYTLLSPKQVCKRLGISLSTLYRYLELPEFPDRIKIGPGPNGAVKFRSDQIDTFVSSNPRMKGTNKTVAANQESQEA